MTLVVYNGRPNVRTSERPNVRTSERPNVRTSERPNDPPSEHPNIPTYKHPNDITSECPNVRTSERPNVRTSRRLPRLPAAPREAADKPAPGGTGPPQDDQRAFQSRDGPDSKSRPEAGLARGHARLRAPGPPQDGRTRLRTEGPASGPKDPPAD
ncbi:hypothetical protein T484DRAFT_1975688 [Baffinella frigidus]|nr:hypothetical protein T484DRAFT_1975688 [Cryptophyta sp. CCMP2293]